MTNEEYIIRRVEQIFKQLNHEIHILTEECLNMNDFLINKQNININKLLELANPFKNSNMPLYFCINSIALACTIPNNVESVQNTIFPEELK